MRIGGAVHVPVCERGCAAHSPQQITPNTAIWQTLQLCSKGGRIGQSKFASCKAAYRPLRNHASDCQTGNQHYQHGRHRCWSLVWQYMSVDLEVPEMGSSSGSRSSFEIHTSGAKPETSTAIVCTGPHFFKLFHDSKSGTSKLCPGLPNRLPAPPARRSPKATRARIPKRDNREKGARSEVGTRRSRFEIHTSGAKPETSTAIICTGARCRRCSTPTPTSRPRS